MPRPCLAGRLEAGAAVTFPRIVLLGAAGWLGLALPVPAAGRLRATDALAPPLAAVDLAAPAEPRSGRRSRTWRARALPGTSVRWGLTVTGEGPAIVEVSEPTLAGAGGNAPLKAECRFAVAWAQRDTARGPARPQGVRELLVRDATDWPEAAARGGEGLLSEAVPRARLAPGGIVTVLIKVDVPEDAAPGMRRGTLVVTLGDARLRARLRVEVLPALPRGRSEPVLAFYRGRLPSALERPGTGWPEVVTEAELQRDLADLRQLGATHWTWYGPAPTVGRALDLARPVGPRGGVVLVGWAAGRQAGADDVRHLREQCRSRGWGEPLFWLADEPRGPGLAEARRRAATVRSGGGLATATLQAHSALATIGQVDVLLLDGYVSPSHGIDAATRAARRAGAEAWTYWQSWVESARHVRWNAGFRRLSAPTSGQALHVLAQVSGSPWDDFDGSEKDYVMAVPDPEGRLVHALSWEAAQAGLEDLRVARAAGALAAALRADGCVRPAVSALERTLETARRRWRRDANERWCGHDWSDLVAPADHAGPAHGELERTRQAILGALLRATRCPRHPPPQGVEP